MLRVVRSELLHRRHRTLALLAGILVATTSFTVLTGTSQSQRLEARGTVAKSFRGDYDVLVRPRGSRSAIERRTGQVQPNFLSGLFGGITTKQWRRIERLPGVEVAAPVANIGYLMPTAKVAVDLAAAADTPRRTVLRARVTWRADGGLTRVPDAPQYAYVTPNRLADPRGGGPEGRDYYRRWSLREYVPGSARPRSVCNDLGFDNPAEATIAGPFSRLYRSQYGCFSRKTGTGKWVDEKLHQRAPGVDLRWTFPMLVTAIDPDAEARLTGLDRTLLSGRYLGESERTYLRRVPHSDWPLRYLPVLVASRTYVDERAELAAENLGSDAAKRFMGPFPNFDNQMFGPLRVLMRQPQGPVAQRARVPVSTAYGELLRQLRGSFNEAQWVTTVWRTGPTSYRAGRNALVPRVEPTNELIWKNNTSGGGLTWAYVSPSVHDTSFRQITRSQSYFSGGDEIKDQPPLLKAVGVFDPDRIGTAVEPGAAPLSWLQPPVLTTRDGGRTLRPSANPGGYLAQPPGLLTTLRAAQAFGGPLFPDLDPDRAISAVRVRVAGVTGIDALSRERIRQAAEAIATSTGLDVDITAGASGAPTAIDLPAGRFGRPALKLSETWIRKGVAARVLSAVDRKSVALFALILVVCALFVANAASAAVRARRIELGVLASLGWSTPRLFLVVLVEVGAIGLAAGVLGGLLALPLALAAGVDASLTRAALAIPAATGLALLAGLVPAARAARADPAAAVRPAVLEARRAWHPRGIGQLALINLLRTPGRTAVGVLSLAIGVCALTLLLAATIAFHDVLVGTLLGDAVAVRVRSTDYIAVAATVLLGSAAVADVLFLNLREQAAELAALRATGWDDEALALLVGMEGLWIGCLGGLVGGAIGLGAAAGFADTLPTSLILTTIAAAGVGVVLTTVAAVAPAAWLRRLPALALLSGE